MISFVMRVHNEEKTLRQSIESLFQIQMPIEIVIVLHRCTDRSEDIARQAAHDSPTRHRVIVSEYKHEISRAGLETLITPAASQHSLMSYYNYAFGLAKHRWKFKWDGDFLATAEFVRWIDENRQQWAPFLKPTVLRVSHRLLKNEAVVSREPYLHNCLLRFAKFWFWEVPVFTSEPHYGDIPDNAPFIHASDLSEVKSYWRQKPWFYRSRSKEAEGLRETYGRAVALVGPEPVGCARSRNPECDAYLERCRAMLTPA
jgi:glycosyltransferase involved in cell wall biosynthesis